MSLIIFCFENGFRKTFFLSNWCLRGSRCSSHPHLLHLIWTVYYLYLCWIKASFDVFNVYWAVWVGLDGFRSLNWKRALNLIFCQTYKMFIVNIKFIQTSISTIVMTIRDRRIHFEHKHTNTKKKNTLIFVGLHQSSQINWEFFSNTEIIYSFR